MWHRETADWWTGFAVEVWAAWTCIDFWIKAALKYESSMTDQGDDGPSYWVGQIGPLGNYRVQISVERRQIETTRAIRAQRPCSEEALTKVASAIAIAGCVKIADRFKSCRPD